jgi:hypothetical protein
MKQGLTAAWEHSQSAQDEAMSGLWKRKNDISAREANDALEKKAIVQENTN